MKLWLVRANCGDYYCGCGGGHVVGIATSLEIAERIHAEAKAATRTYGGGELRDVWESVWIDDVLVPLDALIASA